MLIKADTRGQQSLTCNAYIVTIALHEVIHMATRKRGVHAPNLRLARLKWGPELGRSELEQLKSLSKEFQL